MIRFFCFQHLFRVKLFLKWSVNKETAIASATIDTVVWKTTAVGVFSAVVDQKTKISSAPRKLMVRYSRRRIALIVSTVNVVSPVV